MYSILPFGHTLDSFFDDFDRSFLPAEHRQTAPAFRTDITEEGDHYKLQAELPGFQKGDITIDLKDSVLTISARHEETAANKNARYICRERRYGTFQRSFNISGIQEDAISASYENGILQLILPKVVEVPDQGRKISIQ